AAKPRPPRPGPATTFERLAPLTGSLDAARTIPGPDATGQSTRSARTGPGPAGRAARRARPLDRRPAVGAGLARPGRRGRRPALDRRERRAAPPGGGAEKQEARRRR